MVEETKFCETCAYYYKLEKFDYSHGGCKHTVMPGYICMAFADEGIACWMYGTSKEETCEAYSKKKEKDNGYK